MLSSDKIIKQLQPIFDQLFLDPPNLSYDLSAHAVDEWDSLLQISIVVAVEKHFDIRFRVGEVEATQNVGEFAELIAHRLSEA